VTDVDIAVLGGGPGGYTAAIRAAQLGARVACIDRAPELGGTCLRIGCIPTKAWAQTALALKQADETFGKLGVQLGGSHLDFPAANEWKAAVVKRMTGGVAYLFKANSVTWVNGTGTFTEPNTLAVTGGEDVTFTSAIIATGSFPLRPPIQGLESDRCVDSEGLLAQTEVPRRLVILGGGVIGCEFASIFARFGSQVTIIEMLPALIPQEDADASHELAKQFRRRGITLHLGRQCTKVEDSGSELTVHFGDGQTVMADLMLIAAGRAPLVNGLGLEGIGVEFDRADRHRHRPAAAHHRPAHLRRRRLRRLLATGPHRLPGGRGGSVERLRSRRRRRQPRRPPPDLHRPGDRQRRPHRSAGAGTVRRRRHDGIVPVARERACRDAKRTRRLGQVDPPDAPRGAARPDHGRTARNRHG
jgi:thioredoxin reductase